MPAKNPDFLQGLLIWPRLVKSAGKKNRGFAEIWRARAALDEKVK
jgi:hypothetical protein